MSNTNYINDASGQVLQGDTWTTGMHHPSMNGPSITSQASLEQHQIQSSVNQQQQLLRSKSLNDILNDSQKQGNFTPSGWLMAESGHRLCIPSNNNDNIIDHNIYQTTVISNGRSSATFSNCNTTNTHQLNQSIGEQQGNHFANTNQDPYDGYNQQNKRCNSATNYYIENEINSQTGNQHNHTIDHTQLNQTGMMISSSNNCIFGSNGTNNSFSPSTLDGYPQNLMNNNNNNNNNSNNNNDDNNYNDAKVMRQIISRSLDAMHYHSSTEPILINCGLILLFLPDLVSEYTRVTTISLHMCSDTSSRLQNFGTSLINHLACQVTGDQKLYIGKLLAIEKMLEIIQIKIAENTSDETLEAAWCTLWNITDETLDNCKKFVENDGLNAFKICMDKFSENRDLLKNMMGLLGNVAECPSLRSHFMDADLLYRFLKLLSNPIDTIECSYNACGILAHIMSDGHQIWDKKLGNSVSRPFFLMNMRIVIACWPMNSKRNINYRSFEPIVRLLKPHVPSEAQYWALFALTNLTRVDPAKYCPMLVPHQGLESLRDIANQVYPTEHYVTNLAQITLYQYEKFLVDNDLFGLEQCDSIDLEEIKNFRPMEVDSAEQ